MLMSNKGFEDWGTVLGDDVMAATLIDWELYHRHIVNIRGNSYRMYAHQNLLRPTTKDRRDGYRPRAPTAVRSSEDDTC